MFLIFFSPLFRHKLESSFLIDPEKALAQANLLLVLHDVSNRWTRGSLSPKILRLLHLYPEKESILVLNKIDLLKEKRLLLTLTTKLSEGIIGGNVASPNKFDNRLNPQKCDVVKEDPSCTNSLITEKEVAKKIEGKIGWPQFSNVFMISAIDGDGVADIAVSIR